MPSQNTTPSFPPRDMQMMRITGFMMFLIGLCLLWSAYQQWISQVQTIRHLSLSFLLLLSSALAFFKGLTNVLFTYDKTHLAYYKWIDQQRSYWRLVLSLFIAIALTQTSLLYLFLRIFC